jgi:predicted DNA-binding transcriptional regulator
MATIGFILIAWLVLFGLMAGRLIDWQFWPFVWLPIAIWLVALGIPATWKTRDIALGILDSLAKTIEAWLSRAGYSVDLNQDGYIGYVNPQEIIPEPIEEVRPILVNGMPRLLSQQQESIRPIAETATEPEPETRLQVRRRIWELPKLDRLSSPLKVPQETLEDFLEGIFARGWARKEWVGKGQSLDRDTYDSLIALIEQARILIDRKPGSAGRLSINRVSRARIILGLPGNRDN